MFATELNNIELSSELYNLFSKDDYEDVVEALEEALHRRAADEFADDRWAVTADEIRELRRRGYTPTDGEVYVRPAKWPRFVPAPGSGDDGRDLFLSPDPESLSQERVEANVLVPLLDMDSVVGEVACSSV